MTDGVFLNWIADRLEYQHGDPENSDYIKRLREMGGHENREHLLSEDCWCHPTRSYVSPKRGS